MSASEDFKHSKELHTRILGYISDELSNEDMAADVVRRITQRVVDGEDQSAAMTREIADLSGGFVMVANQMADMIDKAITYDFGQIGQLPPQLLHLRDTRVVVTQRSRDPALWSVSFGPAQGSDVLNFKTRKWDFEPMPSSRTDEWLADHRASLADAGHLANKLVAGAFHGFEDDEPVADPSGGGESSPDGAPGEGA